MADNLRSPLGRAYGLGTAREGAREWWLSRLTSIALVPLCLWWVAAVIVHAGVGFGGFTRWVREPITAVLLILTLGTTFFHIALGLQVVIEDYIHGEAAKLTALIVVKFGCIALAVAGIFAVLRIAFGG